MHQGFAEKEGKWNTLGSSTVFNPGKFTNPNDICTQWMKVPVDPGLFL